MTRSIFKPSSTSRQKPILRRIVCLATLLLVSASLSGIESATPTGIQIVVNAKNPIDTVSAEDLSNLYLKKVKKWKDGIKAMPADQEVESQVRRLFSPALLGRTSSQVESWWQIQLFRGRAVPPLTLSSDSEVLQYIAKHPGGVGYVSAATELPKNVRALTVTH